MASCASASGTDVKSQLEESESRKVKVKLHYQKLKLDLAKQQREHNILEILSQVEKLKNEIETATETETETETETGKRGLRIKRMLRQVKKLCKEESIKYEYFKPKLTELRITDKAARLYMLGRPMAKLIYDRDFTGFNDPSAVQDFIVYVRIAINAFNKRHSTEYKLVEVVKAFRSLPIHFTHSLYFTFTAKLDDDDAAPKTFKAELVFQSDEIRIFSVHIV
ncbi:hypothetical protein ABFX02_06G139400 [Erythranthe guttata]